MPETVRNLDAPADGTTTVVPDTDDMRTNVWVGRSAGLLRAHIEIPAPRIVGRELLVATKAAGGLGTQRMGASVAWNTGPGAWPVPVEGTGSGFAGSTFGIGDAGGGSDTDLDSGVTLTWEDFAGGNGHRWLAGTDLAPGGPLLGVVIRDLVISGTPADAMIGAILADGTTTVPGEGGLVTDGAEFVEGVGSFGDVTIIANTPITDLDDIGVVVFVFATGGAPVAPTSVTFSAIEWITEVEVPAVYEGADGGLDGTGEFNLPHSGPHPHHCPDGSEPYKGTLYIDDGDSWLTAAGTPRSERVTFAPLDFEDGVFEGVTNAGQALQAVETALNA